MPRRAKASVQKDRVSVFAEWLADQPLLTELTLTALTVLFGMQVLRALIPGMVWVFGTRMGWSAPELGLIGLLIVVVAFLSGPLGRLIGNLRLVAIAAAGLALVRFVIQVWWSQPLFNLILAIIGTIFFVIFLPAYFENARRRGSQAISHYALGFLGGIALDVAINGAAGTYDTIWQLQPLPLLLTLLLVIIQLLLLLGITPTKKASPPESRGAKASGISVGWSFTWLAIGPFLFLELVIFQNIPRLATLTGWSLPMTFGFALISQLARPGGCRMDFRKTATKFMAMGVGLRYSLDSIPGIQLPGDECISSSAIYSRPGAHIQSHSDDANEHHRRHKKNRPLLRLDC